MGARCDKIHPHESSDTKKIYESESSQDLRKRKRSATDVLFLILLSFFLTVLLFLVSYSVCYGDIFRIIYGYDDCGNVCGRENFVEGIKDEKCEGGVIASEAFHIILRRNNSLKFENKCVANCTNYGGYYRFFRRCIPIKNSQTEKLFFSKNTIKNFFREVCQDFNTYWPEFLYLCLIALAFSVLMLVLFRFLVGIVVWVVLAGVVLFSCVGSIILWILWDNSRKSNQISDHEMNKTKTYLAFAILATILSLIVILVIFVMRKRIQLVVRLFKEAGKALSSMPLLLLQPILTFLSLSLVITLWIYFSLWIESSGFISEKEPHVYQKTTTMKITRWYNLLAMFWMCQFIIGCQHMVLAGAISDWYFTRNKNNLKSPISTSTYNLVRYHLGSVALGSLLVALVQFLRAILKYTELLLKKHSGKCVECLLKCCQCCLYCFEKLLKFLNRNAYIEIAMYGYPFCTAAKQAFKLLVNNVLRVTAVNSVGDFVLFLGKIVVVAGTVLIGAEILQDKEELEHMWVLLTLAGLFAYFVGHCFMSVYEMAIDTIFLCFCEDCEQNDGINKPYFMSRGLMEFVENSKKVLDFHDRIETVSSRVDQQRA